MASRRGVLATRQAGTVMVDVIGWIAAATFIAVVISRSLQR